MHGEFGQAVPFGKSPQYWWRDGPERKIQDWIMKVLKRYFKMTGLLSVVNEKSFKTFQERSMNIFKLEKDNFNGSIGNRLAY